MNSASNKNRIQNFCFISIFWSYTQKSLCKEKTNELNLVFHYFQRGPQYIYPIGWATLWVIIGTALASRTFYSVKINVQIFYPPNYLRQAHVATTVTVCRLWQHLKQKLCQLWVFRGKKISCNTTNMPHVATSFQKQQGLYRQQANKANKEENYGSHAIDSFCSAVENVELL